MGMCNVYDEDVYIEIMRNANAMTVHFWELKEGDMIAAGEHKGLIVEEDAHESGDACYEGWLFLGADGDSYYPEDFGADLVKAYDENGELIDEKEQEDIVFIVLSSRSESEADDRAIAVYNDEEKAAERVKELQEKDRKFVAELFCDPTHYYYKAFGVL